MTKLCIIVPCYNEEAVLTDSSEKLLAVLKGMISEKQVSDDSIILFVNDGSADSTWDIIKDLHKKDTHFCGLSLSKNAGHQNALLAGMDAAKDFDISITIDADLQDDTAAIPEMVDLYNKENADVVYGVRNNRETDSFFKRTTASLFYKFMKFLGSETVYNHADYRLLSRRAMNELSNYKERNMFLRGIVPKIGFKTAVVTYKRQKRMAGESKYPLSKMLSFAWDGITSLSIKPISMIMVLGLIVMGCSLIALIYTLIAFLKAHTISGWPSLMLSIWFLGGLQLFSIGIIGQYIGKT